MPNEDKINQCLNLQSEKIIRDVIYGYIGIPKVLVKDFIDTKYFQRLRGIEQTNIEVLYPSATHTVDIQTSYNADGSFPCPVDNLVLLEETTNDVVGIPHNIVLPIQLKVGD